MKNSLKGWLKSGDSAFARVTFSLLTAILHFDLPVIRPVHGLLYPLHKLLTRILGATLRVFYWTPLFKSQLRNTPKNLLIYTGMPLLLGHLAITMGDNCRVSGQSTISGRTSSATTPELIVGDNVGISWQNEIFVGNRVKIGNNVHMGVKVRLVGYPGHPVEPEARAKGLPETDDQVGDITLGDDVWLAAGVTVLGGVTIGAGTIVATGSVVTKDLPARVLAAGIPAKVVKQLDFTSKTDGEPDHG
ncbi:MAG: acyltransferase [Endozoicomonas sp.]